MSSLDPRQRQRVETVTVRPTVKPGVTNAELFEAWRRSVKLAEATKRAYAVGITNALRYFTTPEGKEVPVKNWSKTDLWGWAHFVQANYCGNFKQVLFQKDGPAARCRAKVWVGKLPAADATQRHCSGCTAFQPLANLGMYLYAVDKWFKYLSRIGAIAVNLMPDIIAEWREENPPVGNGSREKKRNPTHEEARKLVNETDHPMRRALYATAFKWWMRPNEVLQLDRYASFGLPLPGGLAPPAGFRDGFVIHPELRNFEDGGRLVYLPEKVDARGHLIPEKRRGNRWFVVDDELRPILVHYFAWWERTVRRRPDGTPATTALWLTDSGTALAYDPEWGISSDFNRRTWYADSLRLGLMKPEDVENPTRRLAHHCSRHYGQKKCQEDKVHPDWNKHFRGDAFKDSRGEYFKPEPLAVEREYLAQVKPIGFKPLPLAARGWTRPGEAQVHKEKLLAEAARLKSAPRSRLDVVFVRVTVGSDETWVVPKQMAPSVAFALRVGRPGAAVQVADVREPRGSKPYVEVASLYEKAAGMLT